MDKSNYYQWKWWKAHYKWDAQKFCGRLEVRKEVYNFLDSLSHFLWTGRTWAFFQSEGNFPSFRESLNIIDSGLHIEFPHNFIILILSTSWPWALFGSKLFTINELIILEMSSVEKLTVSSDLLVSFAKLLGKTLLLFNIVHWFAKKSIKKFSFLFKVCYKFIFMKQRRNTRNFFII